MIHELFTCITSISVIQRFFKHQAYTQIVYLSNLISFVIIPFCQSIIYRVTHQFRPDMTLESNIVCTAIALISYFNFIEEPSYADHIQFVVTTILFMAEWTESGVGLGHDILLFLAFLKTLDEIHIIASSFSAYKLNIETIERFFNAILIIGISMICFCDVFTNGIFKLHALIGLFMLPHVKYTPAQTISQQITNVKNQCPELPYFNNKLLLMSTPTPQIEEQDLITFDFKDDTSTNIPSSGTTRDLYNFAELN